MDSTGATTDIVSDTVRDQRGEADQEDDLRSILSDSTIDSHEFIGIPSLQFLGHEVSKKISDVSFTLRVSCDGLNAIVTHLDIKNAHAAATV